MSHVVSGEGGHADKVAEDYTAALTLQICRAMAYTVSLTTLHTGYKSSSAARQRRYSSRLEARGEVLAPLSVRAPTDPTEHTLDERNSRIAPSNQDC